MSEMRIAHPKEKWALRRLLLLQRIPQVRLEGERIHPAQKEAVAAVYAFIGPQALQTPASAWNFIFAADSVIGAPDLTGMPVLKSRSFPVFLNDLCARGEKPRLPVKLSLHCASADGYSYGP
jgi:hypothetical protein